MKIVIEHFEYDGSGGVRLHTHFQDMGDKADEVVALAERIKTSVDDDGKIDFGEAMSIAFAAVSVFR